MKRAESAKTKTSGSNVVVVPVQQEKDSSKTAPSHKNSALTSKADQSAETSSENELSGRIEKQEKLFQAEKSNLEELHRSKVRALEEQITRCKDQLKSQKKDSDVAAAESKKALADVKCRYEKEQAACNKERDALKKTDKQVCTNLELCEFQHFTLCELHRQSSRDTLIQLVMAGRPME